MGQIERQAYDKLLSAKQDKSKSLEEHLLEAYEEFEELKVELSKLNQDWLNAASQSGHLGPIGVPGDLAYEINYFIKENQRSSK